MNTQANTINLPPVSALDRKYAAVLRPVKLVGSRDFRIGLLLRIHAEWLKALVGSGKFEVSPLSDEQLVAIEKMMTADQAAIDKIIEMFLPFSSDSAAAMEYVAFSLSRDGIPDEVLSLLGFGVPHANFEALADAVVWRELLRIYVAEIEQTIKALSMIAYASRSVVVPDVSCEGGHRLTTLGRSLTDVIFDLEQARASLISIKPSFPASALAVDFSELSVFADSGTWDAIVQDFIDEFNLHPRAAGDIRNATFLRGTINSVANINRACSGAAALLQELFENRIVYKNVVIDERLGGGVERQYAAPELFAAQAQFDISNALAHSSATAYAREVCSYDYLREIAGGYTSIIAHAVCGIRALLYACESMDVSRDYSKAAFKDLPVETIRHYLTRAADLYPMDASWIGDFEYAVSDGKLNLNELLTIMTKKGLPKKVGNRLLQVTGADLVGEAEEIVSKHLLVSPEQAKAYKEAMNQTKSGAGA